MFQNLEEENTTFKQKLTIFKDKLKEATLLIENLTEQLFAINGEYTKLKGLPLFLINWINSF